MLKLKENKNIIDCKDMNTGDIAIVIESAHDRSEQLNIIIIKSYNRYVDLSSGATFGCLNNGPQEHPSWKVKILKPGTELIIK